MVKWAKGGLIMTKKDFNRILYSHLPVLNIEETDLLNTVKIDIDGFYAYLMQSIEYDSFNILEAYLRWLISRLNSSSISNKKIKTLFERLSADLEKSFDHTFVKAIADINPDEIQFKSYITDDNPYKQTVKDYIVALLKQDQKEAQAIIMALKGKENIKVIYEQVFQVALYEIGYMWQIGKVGVASEHYITAFTQFMMSQFYDELFSSPKDNKYLVAAAVGNEIHEIGIRMIADMFEFNGWHTSYLGSNLPENELINYLTTHPVDVVALSITMPNHLKLLESFTKAIKAHEQLTHVKVIVGGQPFMLDDTLHNKIGADGYAKSIEEALVLGDDLIAKKS